MSLKIFNTGDIHIGMKFNKYPDKIREKLVEARFTSLENMINKANDLNTNIFVIAGDLFNQIRVSKQDINKVVNILNKFNGEVLLVIPGNHDYQPGDLDLWTEFNNNTADKVLFLDKKQAYSLKDYGLNVCIYPGPCHNKHSEENSIGWINNQTVSDEFDYNIGIAHGAIEGLSPDMAGEYYYMTNDELDRAPVDLWLIGHTHVRYPYLDEVENHKVFNAGTPEPDGLNYKDEGSAWFIEMKESKISAKRILTGSYRFLDLDFKINDEEDLLKIKKEILRENSEFKIVRLNLSGRIDRSLYDSLSDFYHSMDNKLASLLIEDSSLKLRVDESIIEEEFTRGSFPYEFLSSLKEDEDALQIGYELLRRK